MTNPGKWSEQERGAAMKLVDEMENRPNTDDKLWNAAIELACQRKVLRIGLTKLACLAVTHIADVQDWSEFQDAIDALAKTGGVDKSLLKSGGGE